MRRARTATAALLATVALVAGTGLDAEAACTSSCAVSPGRASCTSGAVPASELIAVEISGAKAGDLTGVSWRLLDTATRSTVAAGKITDTSCSSSWDRRGLRGSYAVQVWNARPGVSAALSDSALTSFPGCVG